MLPSMQPSPPPISPAGCSSLPHCLSIICMLLKPQPETHLDISGLSYFYALLAVNDVQLTTKSPSPPIYQSLGNPAKQTWGWSSQEFCRRTIRAKMSQILSHFPLYHRPSNLHIKQPVSHHLWSKFLVKICGQYFWSMLHFFSFKCLRLTSTSKFYLNPTCISFQQNLVCSGGSSGVGEKRTHVGYVGSSTDGRGHLVAERPTLTIGRHGTCGFFARI